MKHGDTGAVRPGFSTASTPLHLGAFVALGCVTLLLGPSLETFRLGAGVSRARIGLLIATSAVGYLFGSLLSGRLLRSRSSHHVMSAGMVIMAAAMALITTVHGLWALAVFEVVIGFGAGFVDVTGNSVVLWTHRGGPVMNALHLCFGLGATTAPILVNRSLAWTNSIRGAYLIVAAVVVALAVVIGRRPSPPDPHDDVSGSGIPKGKGLQVGLVVLFFMAYVGVELGFVSWIFEYGVARGLDRQREASWLGTGFLAAFTLGRLISIPVATRVRPRAVLRSDVVLCVTGLTVMLIGGRQVAAMWTGTIMFGLGTASMFPTMLSLAEPHIPSTSTVTSAFLVGSSVGSMFLPWVIGALIDRFGPAAMPIVVLVGTVICATMVVAFDAVSRGRGDDNVGAEFVLSHAAG